MSALAKDIGVKLSLMPWKSPFGSARFGTAEAHASRYRKWLAAHPHLLRRARRDLAGVDLPQDRWPVDVLASFANDGGRSEEPVFVFGSNLAGRNGRGSAYFAARWCDAVPGVGEGMTGRAYAIPTKTEDLGTRPLEEIAESVARFLDHARQNAATEFRVSRIGCGLARYTDAQIAPMFKGAPDNVDLPYRWRLFLNQDMPPRVIVAGSRDFDDQGRLNRHLDHILSRMDSPLIVSGGAQGADRLGEHYAVERWGERDVPFLRFPADWDVYDKPAGMIRNQEMARCATHLVAFVRNNSRGTRAMIKVAEIDGLSVRVVDV